jgi:ribA/ribD-fused uncharacterized protein
MLKTVEEFELFWNGPFSQWYPSNFKLNNVLYNCAEQYMMAQKALLFNDKESYLEIMNTNNPKYIKELGKKVKNFDNYVWEQNRFTIVLTACIAKFSQNESLKKVLLDTGLKTLVEASPYDKIWGIGLGTDDSRALNKNEWKGLNLLGLALTMAREVIKCKESVNNV